MLQVEHIAKTFGERQVLEDVNLQVNKGAVSYTHLTLPTIYSGKYSRRPNRRS